MSSVAGWASRMAGRGDDATAPLGDLAYRRC